MFAIDGARVIKVAPGGVFSRIHRPASRPPGTPPEPARNRPVALVARTCHAGIRREIATKDASPRRTQEDWISRPRTRNEGADGQRVKVRPAATANGGAIKRR